mgnify:CR=1 FL=1
MRERVVLQRTLGTRFFMVPLLVLALPIAPLIAQEKTSLYIERVDFREFPPELEEQTRTWPVALTKEIQGMILVTRPSYIPQTWENLDEQLKKEQKKEILACTDKSCLNRIVENFGISETVFTTVTYISEGRVQVAINHSATGEIVKQVPPNYSRPDFDALVATLRQMTGDLFGGTGPVTGAIGIIGEKPNDWDMDAPEETIVNFESDPRGAVVTMNGRLLCKETPCSRTIPNGSHRFEMQLVDHLPHPLDVEISKETTRVSAKLTPDFGWINVSSTPEGLPVYIDKTRVGVTPVKRYKASYGRHEVLIRHDQYYEKGQVLLVDRDTEVNVDLEVAPRLGGLALRAVDGKGNDLVADIYIDDKLVGKTPFRQKIIIGRHSIRVSHKGTVWTQDLDVDEKQTLNEVANLDLSRTRQEEERKRLEAEHRRETEQRRREETKTQERRENRMARKARRAQIAKIIEKKPFWEWHVNYKLSHQGGALGTGHGFSSGVMLQPMAFLERRIQVGAFYDMAFFPEYSGCPSCEGKKLPFIFEINAALAYVHYFEKWGPYGILLLGTGKANGVHEASNINTDWGFNWGARVGAKAYLGDRFFIFGDLGYTAFSKLQLNVGVGTKGIYFAIGAGSAAALALIVVLGALGGGDEEN